MEEMLALGDQLLSKLDEISDLLRDISCKLNNVNGIYCLDDIANRIDEAADKVVGETGYNLTDIHRDLNAIEDSIGSLQTTVQFKD